MRVRRATLRARTQVGSVAEHVGQRYLGPHHVAVPPLLHALDLTPPGGQVADHVAHVVLRGDHLDGHDRLQEHRAGLAGGVLHGHGAGDLEGHLGGVDVVVGAVDQGDPDVDGRVAGQHARGERLLDAGVDRGDVLLRDHAAGDLVHELVATAPAGRLEVDHDVRRTGPGHRSGGCSGPGRPRPSCGWSRGRPPGACRRWRPR